MSTPPIPDWTRPYFRKPGGTPFLVYVAFGAPAKPLRISGSRYRYTGLPASLQFTEYGPDQADVVDYFRSGYLWDRLQQENPALAAAVQAQRHCVVLKGPLEDGPTLNDFRNVIGMVTCLLDSGCCALFDAQMFKWWTPQEWREGVFDRAAPEPRAHVTVLVSDDKDGNSWFHTRGMRKFGRPDISIRDVPPAWHEAAEDLCNRFIELQAMGGVVQEGEEVRMAALPPGMVCHNAGSLDDPDFNNVHLEIRWPQDDPA